MKRLILILISCLMFVVVLPTHAAYSYDSVFVTSQRYDRGEMIWRSDLGTIFVLANDGTVMRYSVADYGVLPPNPWRIAPVGKVPPMMGFGKVWANYDEVRAKMGWAYAHELGRNTPITLDNDGSLYMLNQSARPIRIYPNNRWEVVDQFPQNPSQGDPYINQFSVSPDVVKTGDKIAVSWSIGNMDGAIVEMYYDLYPRNNQLYTLQERLPASGTTYFSVPEQDWDSIKIVLHGVRYDNLNDGRQVTARVIAASEILDVDNIPTQPDAPNIRSMSVNPDTAQVGDTITVNWDYENVDAVIVHFYDAYPRNDILYAIEERQPISGSTTFVVPESTLHGITVAVVGVRYKTDNNGREITERLISANEVVDLEDDGLPDSVTTWAVYQKYDNGMMIWRADNGTITVFFEDGTLRNYPLSYYSYLSDAPKDLDVPDGKVMPTNGFGRVWAYLDDVSERLGWATDLETGYDLTISYAEDEEVEYNLPNDGKVYVSSNSWHY